MILASNIDYKIAVFDIESPVGIFDIGIYNPDTKEWIEFEISKYRNDLYSFVKFYKNNQYDYWVSYNGIGFDHQVLQFIVEQSQHWFDMDGHTIAGKIAEFGSKIIENQDYKIPPPFKEYQFSVKPIDVFKIHHFDNEAKRTSLKWCEYMMDLDVEEMPMHFSKKDFSIEEIQELKAYRKHDVYATLCLLYLTLGKMKELKLLIKELFNQDVNLDHIKDYEGKNMIQDRMDVENETGLKCLNMSNVSIGEEWNKLDYMKAEGIKDSRILMNRKIKTIFGQKFKNFFPKTMDFKTDALKSFITSFGEQYVLAQKQEFRIKIGKTTYLVAKGGIHSTEEGRTLKPIKGWILRDADVGSQYPNSILKLLIYPPHLKFTIMEQFKGKITKRMEYKAKGNALKKEGKEEEARPYMSVQEMLKLCLNGGYYGKLNQPGSFLTYPEGYLKVCIGNQIEILMLIEQMELAGFHVVSGNTDGIVVMFPVSEEDKYNQICKEWETNVGNDIMGKLEYTDFEAIWQENINHYIGKKTDGTVKRKGRFKTTEFLLNEKKEKRVINLALNEYLINGTNPIDFITNHKNIYDFTLAVKSFGDLHFEEIISEKEIIKHKKLIRYYVSNEGSILMKRGMTQKEKEMNNHCEATSKEFPWMGQPLIRYFNNAFPVKDFKEYNINYSYYILQTLERIDKIEKTKKAKQYADTFKTEQLQIF